MNMIIGAINSIIMANTETPGWVSPGVRNILEPILMLTMAVFGIAAIICALLQKADTGNVGALSGDTETFMGKNKGSRTEFRLKVATIVLMALILVTSVVYFVIQM